MKPISIATVINITDQSERTLRRRISEGVLPRASDEKNSHKTMIPFEAILSQVVIPFSQEDIALVEKADDGEAEAQNDLGLLFLSHNKAENAAYWFELAAKQDYADAMHWLGRCYLEGQGVTKDENLAMMWLAKAAAYGHEISKAQMQGIRDSVLKR